MIIPAPNRELDQRSLKSLRAKWPAMWSDISKAMQGLKAHSLHMIVLDEVLGFELSNFKRQVKRSLKPTRATRYSSVVERSLVSK